MHERCGIVLCGDAPRALARTHGRLSGYPTVVVGGALPNLPRASTLTEALRILDAQRVLVVHESIDIDSQSADALLMRVAPNTLLAPVVVDAAGTIVCAGSVVESDPARDRARVVAIAAPPRSDPPRALDGRCAAATAETLARYAPARADAPAWAVATQPAVTDGCALALAADVRVFASTPFAQLGDDPRDAATESELTAIAGPSWAEYAALAARGSVRRHARTPLGTTVQFFEPVSPATVVAIGEPLDRAAFESGIRGATPVDAVQVIASDDVAAADAALRNRGDRYVAFVDASTRLEPGWLDACCAALERDELAAAVSSAPDGADGRALVIAASRIPASQRLSAATSVHAALAELFVRSARAYGGVRRLDPPLAQLGAAPATADLAPPASRPRFSGIASIVMLSWNAPHFTKMAVESIRAVTRYPHEIVVVDNGSGPQTRTVLEELVRDHGIRVIYNERNLGFGMGMNVGIAASRGDVVVLLNNDVIVGEGWLEAMVEALERRARAGVTAPRSNKVTGPQMLAVSYADVAQMAQFVAQRRAEHAGEGFWLDRVIGFCMCFDRRVLDEVGGFDPLYGIGNFEDDDLCVRVRGAGWGIFVCDDAFIHHFGSASFAANNVDYRSLMAKNWTAFTSKWGLGTIPMEGGYSARAVHRRGFDRARDYVAPEAAR